MSHWLGLVRFDSDQTLHTMHKINMLINFSLALLTTPAAMHKKYSKRSSFFLSRNPSLDGSVYYQIKLQWNYK